MTGAAEVPRASRPGHGVAAVVIAAAVWGTTGTATHFAPGVPAVVFGAVTFGLGGLALAATGGRGVARALADRSTRRWVLVGAGSLVVYAVAFYAGLADAGVALGTTVAIGSSPVFAGLVEWAADGRRVTVRWGVATAVSTAGMVVVTLARPAGPAVAVGPGLVWALLAGLTYAVYSWAVSSGVRAVPDGPSGAAGTGRGVVGAVFGLAAVPLVVLAVVVGGAHLAVVGDWPVFLYLALVPTALGHSLYAVGLRSVRASVATLLSLLEPVVAAVLAVLVVGEHLGVVGWAGIALVVVGLALLGLPERRRRR